MAAVTLTLFVLAVFLTISTGNASENEYASARIESCRGCSLNRLPDVKQFIFEDVPLYQGVEFKPIPGAVPELILLNENEEEVERLQLSRLNREECNNLLASKGFVKSKKARDEV